MKRASVGIVLLGLVLTSSRPRAAGGGLLWQMPVDGRLTGISAGGGRVFVAGSSLSWDSDLLVRAYDARDGAPLWEDVYGDAGLEDRALGVTQSGGVVFVVGGANHDLIGETSEFLVRAYETTAGTLLWSVRAGNGHLNAATNAMAAGERLVTAGYAGVGTGVFDRVLRTYDVRGGSLLWETVLGRIATARQRRPAPLPSRPLPLWVTEDRVFAAGVTGRVIHAYDARSGEPLWEMPFSTPGLNESVSTLTGAAGRLFAAGGGWNVQGHGTLLIRSYRAINGRPLWESRLEDPAGDVAPVGVAASGDTIFATASLCGASGHCDLLVLAYDAWSGSLIWRDALDGGFPAIPTAIVAEANRLFVAVVARNATGGLDGLLRSYDARTGLVVLLDRSETWSSTVLIAAGGGRVFLAGGDELDEAPRSSIRAYRAW